MQLGRNKHQSIKTKTSRLLSVCNSLLQRRFRKKYSCNRGKKRKGNHPIIYSFTFNNRFNTLNKQSRGTYRSQNPVCHSSSDYKACYAEYLTQNSTLNSAFSMKLHVRYSISKDRGFQIDIISIPQIKQKNYYVYIFA